jgi:gamma-glutamylputrescine oxidase
VAVLEAGRIGSGASGRTGGVVLEGTHRGELPGAERCLEALRETVRQCGIECGLVLDGCLELGHEGEALPGSRLRWSDAGRPLVPVEIVPGGVVDAGRLLSGLARAALAAGATLHEGAAVAGIELGPPLRLETSRGAVRAEGMVLALNAYTGLLLELEPPPLTALTLALASEPLPTPALAELGLDPPLPFYTTDLPYLWGRLLPGGGLVLGSGLVPAPAAELGRASLGSQEGQAGLRSLESRLRALHPALASLSVATRWAGPVALLRDRAPWLGRHPRASRLVVVGGYTGHGVAASVALGARAARSLLDEAPLPDWGALGPVATRAG